MAKADSLYESVPPYLLPLHSFCLLAMLWPMLTGLTLAREQEQSSPLEITDRQSGREQERTVERDIAMNTAVANSFLNEGKAKDALGLYKEAIKSAASKSEQARSVTHTTAPGKEWTPNELLSGNFSSGQKKEIINDLLSKANAWLEQSEYDQAVETFEKIFLLDSLHGKASRGIDKVRRRLIQEKEKEEEVLSRINENENAETIQLELEHAENALKNGQSAEARVHLNRILLIDSENREARKLLGRLEEEK